MFPILFPYVENLLILVQLLQLRFMLPPFDFFVLFFFFFFFLFFFRVRWPHTRYSYPKIHLHIHYENIPIQIYRKTSKPENFQVKKNLIFFFYISAQNIDCGYLLEPPGRGGSNEYPQSMFLSRNKKYNVYPWKPVLLYKSGV